MAASAAPEPVLRVGTVATNKMKAAREKIKKKQREKSEQGSGGIRPGHKSYVRYFYFSFFIYTNTF